MKKVTILLQYILVHSLSTLTALTFINYIPQDLRYIARLYADDILIYNTIFSLPTTLSIFDKTYLLYKHGPEDGKWSLTLLSVYILQFLINITLLNILYIQLLNSKSLQCKISRNSIHSNFVHCVSFSVCIATI